MAEQRIRAAMQHGGEADLRDLGGTAVRVRSEWFRRHMVQANPDNIAKQYKLAITGTHVDGSVDITGLMVQPVAPTEPENPALDMERVRVAGSLRMKVGVRIYGSISLRAAHVGFLEDSLSSWRRAGTIDMRPILDGFAVQAFDGSWALGERMAWLDAATTRSGGFSSRPYEEVRRAMLAEGRRGDAARIGEAGERSRLRHAARRRDSDKRLGAWMRRVRCTVLTAVWWPAGFGYRPGKAALVMVLWVVIGAIIYHEGHNAGHIKAAVPHIYNGRDPSGKLLFSEHSVIPDSLASYPRFSALIYSIDASVPFLDLDQETHWRAIGWTRIWWWIHVSFGWVFGTLTAIALTRSVRI